MIFNHTFFMTNQHIYNKLNKETPQILETKIQSKILKLKW